MFPSGNKKYNILKCFLHLMYLIHFKEIKEIFYFFHSQNTTDVYMMINRNVISYLTQTAAMQHQQQQDILRVWLYFLFLNKPTRGK